MKRAIGSAVMAFPLPPNNQFAHRGTTCRWCLRDTDQNDAAGKKSGPRIIWEETLRPVQAWLTPWAQITRYWQTWSHAPPPPELQALLAHVAHSRPLDTPI